MRFNGKETEINIKTKYPEFIQWKWINMEDLPRVIVDFKKNVYNKILSELKKITF